MFIMQFYRSTECTQFTSLFFTLLFLKPAWFTCHENPPNKCAEITRRNDPPEKIRRGNLPDSCATLTRWIYSPELGAISTRGICLPENPLPRSESPGETQPATLPPPQQLRTRKEGGGGRRLTRLAHASWTGTFTFISLTWMVTYSHMTQHIRILNRAD